MKPRLVELSDRDRLRIVEALGKNTHKVEAAIISIHINGKIHELTVNLRILEKIIKKDSPSKADLKFMKQFKEWVRS